jgi:Cof subfamily protein (haloacid dehalogenase superfamily)
VSAVRLVITDVDGTLLTSEKHLTASAIDAAERLHAAGIEFAVTSGRPPRGLRMLVEPLALTTPLAGFNGGLIVARDLTPVRQFTLAHEAVAPVLEILRRHQQSIWLYHGNEWYVEDLDGPHVERETAACQFSPILVDSLDDFREGVIKIVGVNDTPALVDAAREDLDATLGDLVSATSSQTYYLDVTHHDAHKGGVVDFLARRYRLATEEIAVIGDAANDVSMFQRAGLSIAMGNATDGVQSFADLVTSGNDNDGFARAVDAYVLDFS